MLASFHKLEIDAIQKQTLKSQQPYFREKKNFVTTQIGEQYYGKWCMPKMAKNCWSKTRAPGLRCILVIFLLFYCNDFFEFIHIFLSKFSC